VPVPGEFSVCKLQCWIARTLLSFADVGDVDRYDVVSDGSLVDHSHKGDTQTNTHSEHAEKTGCSHNI